MKFPSPDGESWFNVFRLDGRAPGDVVATVAFVVVADLAIFLPVVSETWVRTLLGLPLVFFLPGYALVSVLFPRRAAPPGSRRSASGFRWGPDAGERIDWIERLALSLGGSLVVLPFVALVLAGLGIGLSGPAVVLTLSAFVLAAMVAGAVRRWRVPPEDRLRAPVEPLLAGGRARLAPTRGGQLLQLAMAASVVAATGGLAFALAVPNASNAHTSAALLTEDGTGELVASGYPTELQAGEPAGLVLALENHEGEETTYTVVVALERIRAGGGDATVVERTVLSRLDATVAAGETATLRHTVEPTMTGEDLRLSYYVYRGDPPSTPGADSAYRHLFLMVNVSS